MAQESISKTVGILGGGPAGCMCAKILSDNNIDVSLIDKSDFLRTILQTGGGRCNLAHSEYDFKNLAKNYPRGEKFLYSVFSRFATKETVEFFKSIGIDTFTREKDNRIFPVCESSAQVQKSFLKSLKCKLIKDKIIQITHDKKFVLKGESGNYSFDYLVIAIGGHSDFNLIKNLGLNIEPPVQSLVGLITKEDFSTLSGVSLKNISAKVDKKVYTGDLLFTHKGVSGPLIYTISSVYARKTLPYNISLKLMPETNLQKILNDNPHKEIKNIISQFIPKSLAEYILNELKTDSMLKAHQINSVIRDNITEKLQNFKITVNGKVADGEVVTCGGVDLKEINSKNMQSKQINGLAFCGEVLDIDGFCGGFNLQNCWSTGYVAAMGIVEELNHSSDFPA